MSNPSQPPISRIETKIDLNPNNNTSSNTEPTNPSIDEYYRSLKNMDELLDQLEKDIKEWSKAAADAESVYGIAAEVALGVGGVILGLVIIIGIGYYIINDNEPTINNNGCSGSGINDDTGKQNIIIDRPNETGERNNNNDSGNDSKKKERVCFIELDPVTLEPLSEDPCSKNNPNPEGDRGGIVPPSVWDYSKPNGGHKNNKTYTGNSNNNDYKNNLLYLSKIIKPRFPEPDDYYNTFNFSHITYKKSTTSSKKQINKYS